MLHNTHTYTLYIKEFVQPKYVAKAIFINDYTAKSSASTLRLQIVSPALSGYLCLCAAMFASLLSPIIRLLAAA